MLRALLVNVLCVLCVLAMLGMFASLFTAYVTK